MTISPRRRQEIVDALRRGTVPHSSLDAFAVGLERFEPALEQELLAVLNIHPDHHGLIHFTADRSNNFRVSEIELGLFE